MTVLSAAITLLLVMDPVGNIPFFLAALRDVEPARRAWVLRRELLIALGVMIAFLFAGKRLLEVLHISDPALSIAGGVILFLISLRMVFPSPNKSLQEELHGEPFIVPLAIPYVAGPSLLASELLLVSREPTRWPAWLLALTIAWLGCAVVIVAANRLSRWLGEKGLIALERLAGMLLVAIAVQMLLGGIEQYVVGLGGKATHAITIDPKPSLP